MEWLERIPEAMIAFLPLLAVMAVAGATLVLADRILRRRWRENPELQFRHQLIMLALTFAAILAVLLALPISDSMRGQLLGLIGILLSAAVALSSTTFIGNIMAGIMLRAIKSIRPGDFLSVADITGRVTEMDLLHTEIQTEDRDLVTVPNLYMVTKPMKVVRASGTIVSAEVSLGYDIPHARVSRLLREAAGKAGLTDAFIQVRDLGDFAIKYRAAGLLEDVKSLISVRSRLREEILDALHGAGIEIVSPHFTNFRSLALDQSFVPKVVEQGQVPTVSQEEVAFDKAEVAASVEEIRKAIEAVDAELQALAADVGESPGSGEDSGSAAARLETRKEALIRRLEEAEALQKFADESE